MNYKKLSVWAYMAVLVACIYSCTDYMRETVPSEYTQAMAQIKYQMSYSDIYSNGGEDGNDMAVATDNPVESDKSDENKPQEKIVYLTFDDGPSSRTAELLDILKEYNIPATFFIVCSDKDADKEIIKRAFDEGHSIGIHSASHIYKKIYRSVDSYLADFETCFNYIAEITGTAPAIFRFPGGSVNSFNRSIRKDLISEMTRRGFVYFDWNVSAGDAEKSYSTESIGKNIIKGCESHSSSVVLMHDSIGKKDTVAALKEVIPQLIRQGYTFKSLDDSIKPVVFKIK